MKAIRRNHVFDALNELGETLGVWVYIFGRVTTEPVRGRQLFEQDQRKEGKRGISGCACTTHTRKRRIALHAKFVKLGRRTNEIVAESSLMHLDDTGMLADGIGGAPRAVRSTRRRRAIEVEYLREDNVH